MPNPITPKEFFKLLEEGKGTLGIQNRSFHEELVIDEKNVNILTKLHLNFSNCIFNKNLILRNVSLGNGTFFNDVRFKGKLIIDNVIANKSDYNDQNIANYSIIFNSISSIEGVYINNCKLDKSVKISNLNQTCLLSIIRVNIKGGGVEINNSKILSHFDFEHNRFSGDLKIYKSNIDTQLRFSDNYLNSYTFIDSTFKKDVWIWAGKVNSIIFNKGVYEDFVKIEALKIKEHLSIVGGEFKGAFAIEFSDKENSNLLGFINELYIKEANFQDSFEIFDTLNNDKSEITKITLPLTGQLIGSLKFSNIKIFNTKISGSNYKSEIHFDNVKLGSFELNKFTNYSNLFLNSISTIEDSDKEFLLTDSILKGITLSNFDFNFFNSIRIKNTDFSEINCSNIKWFDPEKLNIDEVNELNKWAQRRETYMQLKAEMKRQGNTIQARIFRREEMKSHLGELRNSVCRFNPNRFLVWTNQSNNFGESWLKPILLALLFSLIIYLPIIFTLDPRLNWSISFKWSDILNTLSVVFYNDIKLLPVLLNPAHTMDLKEILGKSINPNFWTYFWDIILRIIMSYFIFQTIVAFRKYTDK